MPIFQDSEHGGVTRLPAQLGGIEHGFIDHDAGARALHRLIGRELVCGHWALPVIIVSRRARF
jgi:hypothetical protein